MKELKKEMFYTLITFIKNINMNQQNLIIIIGYFLPVIIGTLLSLDTNFNSTLRSNKCNEEKKRLGLVLALIPVINLVYYFQAGRYTTIIILTR